MLFAADLKRFSNHVPAKSGKPAPSGDIAGDAPEAKKRKGASKKDLVNGAKNAKDVSKSSAKETNETTAAKESPIVASDTKNSPKVGARKSKRLR